MLMKDLSIRLNKLVAAKIPCSRKEAETYITKGLVKINGTIANSPGARFPATVSIELDRRQIDQSTTKLITIMLNKPLGYVSTQPEPGKDPAIKLLTAENELNYHHQQSSSATRKRQKRRPPEPYTLSKMAVAGRLDINTTGLLLFTQCGNTASQIIGNDTVIEKEYLVRLKPPHDNLTGDFLNVQSRLRQLRNGILDENQLLLAKSVLVQNDEQLLITLTSGKRHQIRRMIRAVGWQIQAIKRTRIGPLRLGSLPVGKWRYVDVSRELIVTADTSGGDDGPATASGGGGVVVDGSTTRRSSRVLVATNTKNSRTTTTTATTTTKEEKPIVVVVPAIRN